jgi:hypothetical protein
VTAVAERASSQRWAFDWTPIKYTGTVVAQSLQICPFDPLPTNNPTYDEDWYPHDKRRINRCWL